MQYRRVNFLRGRYSKRGTEKRQDLGKFNRTLEKSSTDSATKDRQEN